MALDSATQYVAAAGFSIRDVSINNVPKFSLMAIGQFGPTRIASRASPFLNHEPESSEGLSAAADVPVPQTLCLCQRFSKCWVRPKM